MYIIDDHGSPRKVGAPPPAPVQQWPTLSSMSALTDSTVSIESQAGPSEARSPRTPEPRHRGSWHPHLAPPRRAPPLVRSPDRIGGHGINFWRNEDASGVFTQGMIHGTFHARRAPHSRQLDRKEERAAMAARQIYLENRLRGLAGASSRGQARRVLQRSSFGSSDEEVEVGESMQEDGYVYYGHSQLLPEDTMIIDHEAEAAEAGVAHSSQGGAMRAESTFIIDHSQSSDREQALAPNPCRQESAALGLQSTELFF